MKMSADKIYYNFSQEYSKISNMQNTQWRDRHFNIFIGYSTNIHEKVKALSHEEIFSCNLQRNGVSSCLLQEKSPPVTLLVCKIIRLQVIQQLAYVYNSTGA